MSDERGEQIIIVRPRKASHAAHGGAWKVAYADFVTAMMAFFIVMWIVGLSPETRKAIAAYFQDPTASKARIAAMAGLGDSGGVGADGKPVLIDTAQQRYENMKKELQKQIDSSEKLKKMQQSVEITVTEDGLRVELMDSGSSPFFDVGSADMKPETGELLSVIGAELKGEDRVSVEGHTDARELSRENYSNWELSCDRANAARRVLEPILEPDQIDAIRGYADTQLRDTEDPLDPKNRRVTILVKPPATATDAESGGTAPQPEGAAPAEGGETAGDSAPTAEE